MIPEGLAGRVGLGLAAAGLLLGASYWWVEASAGSASPASTAPLVVPSVPDSSEVLASLQGGGIWLVYMSAALDALPAAAAPVVAVDVGGRLRLLRPPPPAAGPASERWLAAGIVLPSPGVAALGSNQRAALLDALAALAAGRELRRDQLVPVGLRTRPGGLAALLRWLR